MTGCAENGSFCGLYDKMTSGKGVDALLRTAMNRVVYTKEKELTVMAQKKKDSKMMGKIIKTAVSGVLCVALAGGMVAANVLIPPNASSVQSILGLKSGGIDNSKAKTEGINMEYSKPGFDTEAALVEDEIALNKKIAAEGIVLLKNDAGKMPYSTDTTFSFVSHSAVSYIGGNKVDMKTAFEDAGFGVNEALWKFYSEGNGKDYGLGAGSISYGDDEDFSINECPLSVMKAEPGLTDSMKNTVPVFVLSRVAGEGRDMPRSVYNHTDVEEDKTKTYLEPDSTELEILQYLNDNFDDVVLLLNSSAAVDLSWVENYPNIHTVISAPAMGDYGLCSLAEIFSGKVNPSGRTVDTYEVDAMNSPAAQNFGDFAYYDEDGNLTKYNYVSYKEGIYVGYRYYETRYEDKVLGQGNAGDYNYADAVMYPFGYGLSYTDFEWSDYDTSWDGDTCTVTVKVTNTGDVAGKDVVQVYAQSPYTDYDKANKVEKAAVELVGYAKTAELAPGASETVTVTFDQEQLKSYDYVNAKTYILDAGDYYITAAKNAHEAVNNILSAKGKTVADGMTADGDASKTYQWTWDGAVDADTFSVSKAGVEITNAVSDGDYSMDINTFIPGTATYLSRSDWDGTFPTTITGLKAEGRLATLLANDFIDIKTDEDTSDIVFGDTTSTLTLNDLKGADFDDPRWDELVGKVTIDEFLNFASNAFHNIQNIDSVGLPQYAADDGPNGSDSHYLTEGSYQGTPYADAADYDYGTRVGPTPENIAYSWNKELAYRVGEITLGESTLVLNLPIMIGPGMNIHRHGYNARGAEYYSEDPVLSGYTGSAVVQGAQSKGTLVNIKHAAFNDQEINRSGIAVFMTEQKARELELRNLQQAFEGNGKPASFEADPSRDDTYTVGALGVMTSYNRIGAVASSANAGVQVQIMRNEWGFKGYNVTDFTGVTLHASPKESILAGTTAFCGFGTDDSITYWNADALKGDRTMLLAIKQNIHYLLYALANSAAMNGVNSTTRTISVMTWWRMTYRVCIYGFAALTALCALLYVVSAVKSKKQKTAKEA